MDKGVIAKRACALTKGPLESLKALNFSRASRKRRFLLAFFLQSIDIVVKSALPKKACTFFVMFRVDKSPFMPGFLLKPDTCRGSLRPRQQEIE